MFAAFAKYPTFTLFAALLLSMMLVALIIPLVIRVLRALNIGQQVRVDGPERHIAEKQGTPTMGGLAIIVIAVLVFALLAIYAAPQGTLALENYTKGLKGAIVVLVTMLACGALGFIDDYSKVVNRRSLGLGPLAKLIVQASIGLIMGIVGANWVGVPTDVLVPFSNVIIPMGSFSTELTLGALSIQLPWLYLAFIVLLTTSMTNAVNLTDGLDGLATGTVMIVTLTYAGMSYAQNNLPVAIAAAAITGACIGFLWWNSHPADIFMGDTGSLALGGAIAGLAMVTSTELLVAIIGGIFVVEALSVSLQVIIFKRTRKRLFKMAPIHHHFEQIGWSETKVTIRFWIVSGIFAGLGFAIYFLQFSKLVVG